MYKVTIQNATEQIGFILGEQFKSYELSDNITPYSLKISVFLFAAVTGNPFVI